MSPSVGEDLVHGLLFRFILDMSSVTVVEPKLQDASALGTQRGPADTEDARDESEGRIHRELLRSMSVSLCMFKQDEATSYIVIDDSGKEVLEEAFDAFMRLQLVRKQACLLNNAMVMMRNVKGDLSSMFDWKDISSDKLIKLIIEDKLDRRKSQRPTGLNGFPGNKEVPTGGLLVFRYTLIDSERLDLFVRILRHRHMPVMKAHMDRVLHEIKSRRKDDHRYYFAHLYPHLAKVERLSTEIKVRYRGRRQFEFIADMVFNVPIETWFGARDSLYHRLREILGCELNNSSLSLGSTLP
ncbi:hypothetical protein CRENBAI_008723 [Crenichthys baileyi]|uniref:Uncharacterized protein n=1 Tax=Crenichthys baileyi TaxID=28760 RepID=A0AAV9RMM5_9TELE